jgi:hypothetical protein
MHRVSIILLFFVRVCKCYQAAMHVEFIVIFVYLFQENKSYGNKPFACYVTVPHRHVWHSYVTAGDILKPHLHRAKGSWEGRGYYSAELSKNLGGKNATVYSLLSVSCHLALFV